MPIPRSPFFERLIRWRFLLVINLVVIALLSVSLGREMIRSQAIDAQIADLQAQADTLAARNIEISELKTALQTESYIEREARLKLGMKKPGESVVVIQEDMAGGEDGEEIADASDPLGLVISDAQASISVANPTKWWYYFFDKESYHAFSQSPYE